MIINRTKYKKLRGVMTSKKKRILILILTVCVHKREKEQPPLSRITPFTEVPKRQLLMKVFFMFQFNCCPIV